MRKRVFIKVLVVGEIGEFEALVTGRACVTFKYEICII